MKKRLIALLLITLFIVFAACAKETEKPNTQDSSKITDGNADTARATSVPQTSGDTESVRKVTPEPEKTEAPTEAPVPTDTPAPTEDVNAAYVLFPWEYGDTDYTQRVRYDIETIEIRGRVPEGSRVTAECPGTNNAAITKPSVKLDGSFTCNLRMFVPGDYTVIITCTTPNGESLSREMHVQRSPEYSKYKLSAKEVSFSQLSESSAQALRIRGRVTELLREDDMVLAVMELTDGNTVVLEYHQHYGSAGTLTPGKNYEKIYGRALGLNTDGIPQIYVWFIDD